MKQGLGLGLGFSTEVPNRSAHCDGRSGKGLMTMQVVVERCAFLDVHRDTVMACARTLDSAGGRREEVAEFRTTTSQLLVLSDWLTERGSFVTSMDPRAGRM